MSHEQFMQAIDLYERAMKTRDALELDEAIRLFEEASNLMSTLDITVPLQIAFSYDMALAYDLAEQHERAITLFKKAAALYHHFSEEHPEDPAVEGFAGLIWGVNDYLSLWENASMDDDNYLSALTIRRWDKNKMPLKILIDNSADTGFDTTLSEIIAAGFQAWTEQPSSLTWIRTDNIDEASILVTRVSDGLGSAGGHTGFEEITAPNGAPQLHFATIRISMHSPDASAYNERELRALKALAIHEAGHALGLDGHSPHATDLMYWKSPLQNLSARDVKTFQMLYG
jgi:tetratricopeptide (TPR) repeat protein